MTLFLALLGGLIAALGVIGVVRPATLLLLVHSAWRSKWALYYAVASRVPEPGTLVLLTVGLFGLGLARRRRARPIQLVSP